MKSCRYCGKEFKPKNLQRECSKNCYLKYRVKIDENGCWIWTGKKNKGKHPMAYLEKSIEINAAYLSYSLYNEKEPIYMIHSCGKSLCINPDHLTCNEIAYRFGEGFKSMEDLIKNKSIVKENGCWEWCGTFDKDGYGCLKLRKKTTSAHRLSFEVFKKEKIDDKCVCHTCDNRKCVNPDHLWLGTNSQNILDCLIKKRHHSQHAKRILGRFSGV